MQIYIYYILRSLLIETKQFSTLQQDYLKSEKMCGVYIMKIGSWRLGCCYTSRSRDYDSQRNLFL